MKDTRENASLSAAAKSASVVSDSVRPHRWQTTKLCHPWDSPGKSTGVGCHFLLQCMKVKNESEVAQSCPILLHPMDCSVPGSSVHGIFQARALEWVPLPSPRAQWEGNNQKPTGGLNLKLSGNAFEFKKVSTMTSFRNLGKIQVKWLNSESHWPLFLLEDQGAERGSHVSSSEPW